MNIEVGAQEFTITVPDGVAGGDAIEVELPLADEEPPPEEEAATELVVVTVPDGLGAGDVFTVETAWGGSFDITVPDGIIGGDAIEVELPTQAASAPPPEQQAPPRQHRPPARTPHELVGRRAFLVGLVAKGVLNGRKGTVNAYNVERDRIVLTIDGMCPDVAVKWENLQELPSDDEAPPDDEPPEAPPAGVHYVGDRVLVERSNGSTSLATIVEYDEVMENYVVDIGNGILKYGVEESYITPYETSSEWAGPSKMINGRWEGYFVGRKVRIPHLGRGERDKNGSVRSYDAGSGLYTVAMESGVIRRSIKKEQIKVMYQLVPK